jgi:hypothetical protein
VDEARYRIEQAKAYMQEAGFRRIKNSTVLTLLKVVPGIGDPIDRVQEISEAMLTQPEFESEPLAYLAFASETFTREYRCVVELVDERRPLAQIVEETLADSRGYELPPGHVDRYINPINPWA